MNLTIKDIIDNIESVAITGTVMQNLNRPIIGAKKLTPKTTILSGDVIYLLESQDFENRDFKNMTGLERAVLLFVGADQAELDLIMHFCVEEEIDAIMCGDGSECDEVLNQVQDLIMAKQALLCRPAALFDTIVKGRGVPYLLEIAGELLENPVLLGDGNHRLIGSSSFPPLDDIPWMEYRNTGFCTYEYTRKYQFEEYIEASVKSDKAIIGPINENFKYRRIFCTVVSNNRVVGHLAVLEYNRPFTAKDMEICEYICEIIGAEMQDNLKGATPTNLMANQLFSDLLGGQLDDEAMLEKRLTSLKWRLPKRKYLLTIPLDEYSESFGLIAYLKEKLAPQVDFLETTVIGGELIVLLGLAETRIVALEQLESLEDYLNDSNLFAGLSQEFVKMSDFAKAYGQTRTALTFNTMSPGTICHYQDYVIDDLLLQSGTHLNLEDYCHQAILRLHEYDIEHHSDLLDNLYVYIINMGNLLHSANQMFIHRNTLSYRLNKICEITGCDIHDQRHFINLFVSYKIMKLHKRS